MKLKLKDIYEFQIEFDQLIYSLNNVKVQNVRNQLHLAMMTELMELCNEIRCFNYWSNKQRNNDEIVLSELADVLSFAISEGVEFYNIQSVQELQISDLKKTDDKQVLTNKFLNAIHLYDLIKDQTSSLNFLKEIIELGYMLGYNFKTQIKAYKRKCLYVKEQQLKKHEEKQ